MSAWVATSHLSCRGVLNVFTNLFEYRSISTFSIDVERRLKTITEGFLLAGNEKTRLTYFATGKP